MAKSSLRKGEHEWSPVRPFHLNTRKEEKRKWEKKKKKEDPFFRILARKRLSIRTFFGGLERLKILEREKRERR